MERKKAIITGASHGIGRGIALKFASKGYDIAVSYNQRPEGAKELAEEIEKTYGTRCFYYQASLEQPGVGTELFNKAAADLGGVDVLVNNAGVTRMSGLLDMPEEQIDLLVALDFKNYILMAKAAAVYMHEHGIRGSIVNITSSRGERAYPGDSIYGGMKAALNRAIQSLAIELGPLGIRINNVAPGYTPIMTDKDFETRPEWKDRYYEMRDTVGHMIPLARYGTPEDIANAVAFLASDEASYITGVTLRVDGGLILPGMPESPAIERNVRGWGYSEHYGFMRKRAEEEKKAKEAQEQKNSEGENKK